ncbi:acyltransferase [Bradyrhizobium manausense]|uniref:acyltransferase family protein n=1 Tax=Bradyrhizobium manausense TaxID=989370 RepID=UPI001BA8B672|nr:acyltransferase family protein [Bradyrhizobium manausense]MBR1092294.1 acyltransferase [Bradyrhizobium manausense]
MKYRADIDGLRAAAVVPVVLFHSGFPGFSGGYVGVDIFFVISGFVITLGLKDDLEAGRFSIFRFYVKRIRRIFPALAVTILATFVAAYFVLLPEAMVDLSRSMMASAAFLSNVYFWKSSSYFAADSSTRPLLHTWSLSVEEQYYVFIPLAVYVTYIWIRSRWLIAFGLAAILSFGLSLYATRYAASANFYLLPTRAWELLIGTLLALFSERIVLGRRSAEAAALTGALFIAYAVFSFDESTPFPGFNAALPCFGAGLLIFSGTAAPRTWISTALSSAPVVWIGKISYSVYLVHWPLAVLVRSETLEPLTLAQSVTLVTASILLGALSWKYVEQPFRRPHFWRSNAQTLFAGLALLLVFFGIGAAGVVEQGFPGRFPRYEARGSSQHRWNEGSCFFEPHEDYRRWSTERCQLTHGAAGRVLLWGDSFAAQYVPGIRLQENSFDVSVFQYTSAGCPPVLTYYSYAQPQCADFNRHAIELIKELGVVAVVLSARWIDLRARGGVGALESTLDELSKMKVGVYVIGQSPEFPADVRVIGYRAQAFAANTTDSWRIVVPSGFNDELRKVVKGKATFIDPLQSLCADQEVCPYRKEGQYLFSDFGHLSTVGSSMAVQSYFPKKFPQAQGRRFSVP